MLQQNDIWPFTDSPDSLTEDGCGNISSINRVKNFIDDMYKPHPLNCSRHTHSRPIRPAHHAQIAHTPPTRLLHSAAPRLLVRFRGEPASSCGPGGRTWQDRQPAGPAPGGSEDRNPQHTGNGQGAQADTKGHGAGDEEDASALQRKTEGDARKFQPKVEGNLATQIFYSSLSSHRWVMRQTRLFWTTVTLDMTDVTRQFNNWTWLS